MPLTQAQAKYYDLSVLYGATAAPTWLAYDVLINLDREIECIWRRPRAWVKVLYFFTRYVPILHEGALLTFTREIHFSDSSCKGWIYYELIFAQVLTLSVEVVLVMRLYVLFSRSKAMLWTILLALTAEITSMAVMLAISLPRLSFTPSCLLTASPAVFVGFWISSLIFETFLFVLTVIKFIQSVSKHFGKQSVMYLIMRDGTWAFALIFVTMLLNLLMYKLMHSPLAGMGYGLCLSVMSFSGSHILLNLRSVNLPRVAPNLTTLPTLGFEGSLSRQFDTGMDWRDHLDGATEVGQTLDGTVESKALGRPETLADQTHDWEIQVTQR